jgi:hypothetical protein
MVELLAGKTPEAVYDALHAGRYLSEEALRSPAEVVTFIKELQSSRQRPLMPANKLERLALALARSGFLSEAGKQLCGQAVRPGWWRRVRLPPLTTMVELLAGKTPEAMYDALHAGRYLSAEGLRSPADVLNLIEGLLGSSGQWAPTAANELERLASALARSGLLNEAGRQLCGAAAPPG